MKGDQQLSYVHNLGIAFENVAKQYSDSTAIRFCDGQSLTYQELNSYSNQLARYLHKLEIKRGDVVCIAGDKTISTFSCMLACLKLGVAYSILDPESPAKRLGKIFSKCDPRVVLANNELLSSLRDDGVRDEIVLLDNDWEYLGAEIGGNPPDILPLTSGVTGENPAYIMFTSGSTGFPKGAMMTHNNVMNFIAWAVRDFEITPQDVFTNVNPLYFDNAVFDFYVALFSGATLVPFSKNMVRHPGQLVEKINELGCTSWFSVPSMLLFLMSTKALNRDSFASIKRVIFGGEGYPKSKLKDLYNLYSDKIKFFNVSGPTECTCICSLYEVTAEDFTDLQGFPPIGRIIDNFSYLIVDANNKPVPEGERGELCLIGPNVGRGYYNDPDRTALGFIQNPQNTKYREIIYKTGDIVSYNAEDGKIYIFGRADNQVKHMGYRIELEEIENGLCCLPYVSQAAVVHGYKGGLSQIVAVVQVREDTLEKQIRSDLKSILPGYMIPTVFQLGRGELPKNQNDKLNRRAIMKSIFSEEG